MKKDKKMGAGKFGATIGIKELEESTKKGQRARKIQLDGENYGNVILTMLALTLDSQDDILIATVALAKAYGEMKAAAASIGFDVTNLFQQEAETFEREKRAALEQTSC